MIINKNIIIQINNSTKKQKYNIGLNNILWPELFKTFFSSLFSFFFSFYFEVFFL